MKERFWLIKNGVPWHIVFGDEAPWQDDMPEAWAFGMSVVFSEFANPHQRFNWNSLRWEEKK